MKTSPTLEAYTELQTAYDHFNARLFGDKLPQCLITFQREKNKCIAGYFSPARFIRHDGSTATDEIAMNPMQFKTQPLIENLKTMGHEMCHQWQHHYGKSDGRISYHNREWGERMKSIGLYPSSTGVPGGKETGQSMDEYLIEGGPFDKAAAELMTRDFVLSWADRAGGAGEGGGMPQAFMEIFLGGMGLAPAARAGRADAGQVGGIAARSGVRVKYFCPKCGVNVWGKSELNIVCGSCGVGFCMG